MGCSSDSDNRLNWLFVFFGAGGKKNRKHTKKVKLVVDYHL